MFRRDFTSKYIDELSKKISYIISLKSGKDDFDYSFNEMLQTYFLINDDQLSNLLEENEDIDQYLLAG